MASSCLHPPAPARGFSLLELMVAIAILGFSLGAMYQVAGGATRTVSIDQKTVYAVELARSLLANYAVVPLSGLGEEGETEGGFSWTVQSVPIDLPEELAMERGQLQTISVAVNWPDGDKQRQYTLQSVAVGREVDEF